MLAEIKPLTALRGIAALCVVGFHINLWMPVKPMPDWIFKYGGYGVDFFFVLSGYVLATVYRDMRNEDVGMFLVRRIFRIYPLHVFIMIALGVEFFLAPELTLGTSWHNEWWQFVPMLLLIHPLLRIQGQWNSPSWSVGIEMICYTAFPLLIGLIRKLSRSRAVLLLMVTLVMLVYVNFFGPGTKISGLSALLRGFCGFTSGCLLRNVVEPTAISHSKFLLYLSPKPIHWVGEISYSIYLLHAPLLSVAIFIMPFLYSTFGIHLSSQIVTVLFIVVLISLSFLTYLLIEQPCRKIPSILFPGRGRKHRGAPLLSEHLPSVLTRTEDSQQALAVRAYRHGSNCLAPPLDRRPGRAP